MEPLPYLFLLLFVPFMAQAQPSELPAISGRVVEVKNGAPVSFATVICYDDKDRAVHATVTDKEGRFALRLQHRGDYGGI